MYRVFLSSICVLTCSGIAYGSDSDISSGISRNQYTGGYASGYGGTRYRPNADEKIGAGIPDSRSLTGIGSQQEEKGQAVCEYKAVMTDNEIAICRAAAASTTRR